jgi:hypothetical protein
MASCAYCGNTIVFGGERIGDQRFCNAKCRDNGKLNQFAAQISDADASSHALRIHGGLCPRCSGMGPIDVYDSYRIWSALYLTRWQSRQVLACRACGRKAQIGDLVFSAFLGWWGFPFGLIMTPVQIYRNAAALSKPPNPTTPSPKLIGLARKDIASHRASGTVATAPTVRV